MFAEMRERRLLDIENVQVFVTETTIANTRCVTGIHHQRTLARSQLNVFAATEQQAVPLLSGGVVG